MIMMMTNLTMQSVRFLLSNSSNSSTLKLNETNSKGLTALDVMDLLMENTSDVQLRETLRIAGAIGAREITNTPNHQPPGPTIAETAAKEDWIKYFRFQKKRDSPSNTRNALLVVVALIATVTFQAGVDPPNFQSGNSTNTSHAPPPTNDAPRAKFVPPTVTVNLLAGTSTALGGVATSDWFLLGNSLGFASSVSVIIYLTAGFPFQRELHISIYSIMFAYGFSVISIQPKEGVRYPILGIAFLVPFLARWLPRWTRKFWRLYRNSSWSCLKRN